jgi:hypothetical protein
MIRRRTVNLALMGLFLALATAGPARAQDREETEGTSDFRDPPMLVPGSYSDTIVSGESVWYAVLYTNDVEFRIEVDLVDVDLDAQDELTLTANFISPTLGGSGSGRLLEGSTGYSAGGTNVWYIEVDLATSGRLGVEHQLSLDIDGFSSDRLERCELPDCTAADDLAAIETEIAQIEENLAALDDTDAQEVVEEEIADLEQRQADARQEESLANDEIAAHCAPEPDCDTLPEPGSSTPLWALLVSGAILLSGAGVLATGLRGRQ